MSPSSFSPESHPSGSLGPWGGQTCRLVLVQGYGYGGGCDGGGQASGIRHVHPCKSGEKSILFSRKFLQAQSQSLPEETADSNPCSPAPCVPERDSENPWTEIPEPWPLGNAGMKLHPARPLRSLLWYYCPLAILQTYYCGHRRHSDFGPRMQILLLFIYHTVPINYQTDAVLR